MPDLLVEKAGTHLEQQYHYLEQLKQNSQNKPSLHTTQFGIFFSQKQVLIIVLQIIPCLYQYSEHFESGGIYSFQQLQIKPISLLAV